MTIFSNSLSFVLRRSAIYLARLIPLPLFRTVIKLSLSARLARETPENALRLLLEVENWIYRLMGPHAIAYGSGTHIKDRYTQYSEHLIRLALKYNGPYLDVGCRWGQVCGPLSTRTTNDVVGIEIDPDVLSEAKRRYNSLNLTFVLGDVTSCELNQQFNTIILSNVLEHIEDRITFLSRLVRLYNPETFLIRVPNFERDWRIPLKKELGVDYRNDDTHFIEHTPDEFFQELSEAGLSIETTNFRWGEIWAIARLS